MKDELLSYLISYDGVCRTAQATQGLLLTFYNPKIPHTQDTESLDQCGKEQRYHEKNSDLKKNRGSKKCWFTVECSTEGWFQKPKKVKNPNNL